MVVLKKTLLFYATLWLAHVPVASLLQQHVVRSRNSGQGCNIVAEMARENRGGFGGDSDGSSSSSTTADEEPQTAFGAATVTSRRQVFSNAVVAARGVAGVATACCCCCNPSPAFALAQITTPPPESLKLYDLPRNALQDAAFAQGMAVGMVDYEKEAYPAKKRLFRDLFRSLERTPEPIVVEIGIGSFPNALYYAPRLRGEGGLDIVGVDPNDRMGGYARDNAARAGLGGGGGGNAAGSTLRIVHGVSEALPLEDGSCDAVVCSLTLCSVADPARSVAEIRRVLKPGGKFLFWEHVLSETDPELAVQQVRATPAQVQRADGCHLDRRSGEIVRNAGFKSLDMEYIELKNFGFLNPTVCGIATA